MKSRALFGLLFSFFFSFIFALAAATSSSAVASERSTVTFALDNDGIFGVDQD
ncbi:MAG: hypothetical protein ACI971_002099 [Colwellia sp.]|jgi:hypothetical protein